MKSHNEDWGHTVRDIGRGFQSEYTIAGTISGLYAAGTLCNLPRWRACALELAAAQAIAGLGTQVVKMSAGRDRPYMENGPSHFVEFTTQNGHQSFFSGDVTVAFVQASVLSAEFRSLPLATVLYGLAACTAFQRLSTDRHWLSDTVAAAAWGTAVGWGVVRAGLAGKRNHLGVMLSPTRAGITYQF